jgi:hypothetical protein
MNQQAISEGVVIKDISREPRVSSRNAPRKITHTITLVPCNYVGTLWNDIKHFLGPAIARSRDRWDIDSVHQSLLNEERHVWVAFDEFKQIDGVATTEFVIYPKRKMLSIEYLGGKNMNSWGWDLLDRLYSWAKDNECDGIEAVARHGFWKWMQQDGFERSYTIYEKEII